ncbi:YktB family protein [Desulfuribacillus alkaliarsenatis]|uniref:Uncharacterized protein n=1 Tax=Desulfuribacillus alkaliarsenatis TaxID=766136 RepID=A0A1E5G422_9FIRM|nr:DUF1054 domain-containing protein [Desulfuribacillus alkaliarsenatis]OEF97836.1 hypothetical protein BHF68_13475 [Desulfuribacillus alkaliarsenatis]
MSFTGFDIADFDVLNVHGLDPRMAAILTTVRPKLTAIGEHIAPFLSAKLGQPIYPHVARHARRTVNPPDDTWVAFSTNPRGYKALPHFQVGIWSTHAYIDFAIIYESQNKTVFADNLAKQLTAIKQQIPANYTWSLDHTKPHGEHVHHNMSDELFNEYIEKLKTVKKSEITCGIELDKNTVINMDGQQFLQKIEDTFERLLPLYRISF